MSQTIADLIETRFGLPSTAGRALPAEGPVAGILSHRTHRRYRPDPVPDEVLEIVLAAALSAPSKSDLQQVAIIVVRDRVKQATIGGWIPDMPWIAQAPLFMVFCGDHRRIRRVAELRDRPFPNDTLDMFMNAAVDAGLVLESFITRRRRDGPRMLPDQRGPEPRREARRPAGAARGRVSRGWPLRRLPRAGGAHQHAAAAGRHRPHRPL